MNQFKSKRLSLLFLVLLFISCTSHAVPEVPKDSDIDTNVVHLAYTNFKTYAYVQTDFTSAQKKYTIEYPEKITSAVIRPYQLNIPVTVADNKISFSLPKVGHYVAYINGFKIIIYAEEPEILPSGNSVINMVKNLGCDTTGTINETSKIQSAISGTPSDRILYFPPGRYLVSQLRIQNKTGLSIYLARGAQIIADTMQLSSYDLTNVFGAAGTSSIVGRDTWPSARTFILIDECQNIDISGCGMINGQGRAARRNSVNTYTTEGRGRYQNFIISRSKNVTFKGVISADPGAWNTHILKSNSVTFSNVKLMNELDYAPIFGNVNNIDHDNVNTDGFDIDSSSDVLIENCFGYCADDNIAIKTSQCLGLLDNVDGVIVRNNVFLTQKSSLKVGTETGGSEMKNILFSDNDILEADRAISLYCYDGTKMSNIKWVNTRLEECYQNNQKRVIQLEVLPRVTGSKVGCATSIEINDTYIRKAFPNKSTVKYSSQNASTLCAQTSSTSMQISISNFVVNGVKVTSLSNDFTISGNPTVTLK